VRKLRKSKLVGELAKSYTARRLVELEGNGASVIFAVLR